MLAGAQKLEKIGGGNSGCAIIAQRMKVERIERQHGLVQNDADLTGSVVHDRKRRHGTWLYAECRAQQFARAEGEARRAQRFRQFIEIDFEVVARHDEPESAFAVLEKEILRVAAGLAGIELCRLSDREDWGVDVRRPGDAEFLQPGIEHGFAFGRRGELQAQGAKRLIHSGSAKAAAW